MLAVIVIAGIIVGLLVVSDGASKYGLNNGLYEGNFED